MRFESTARERIERHVRGAFEAAADDVVTLAQATARKDSRTGRFAGSITRTDAVDVGGGRLEARVGSPLSSARAKERGAYIRAKRGPYLVFNAGDGVRKVEAVRLAPQPAVTPAGARFPRLMAARLEQGRP